MSERFRPVENPEDTYSEWDQGWQLLVAWGASSLIVLLGVGHFYVAVRVVEHWAGIR